MSTDYSRIYKILKFALAVAAQNDEWDNRELGPIHLIKYLYLADLAYAEVYNGETYTGINWRFHKFGPWSEEANSVLETALKDEHIQRKKIESQYDDDFIRWRHQGPDLVDQFANDLDLPVFLGVKDAVQKFGSDTEDLLNHVYLTLPMLNASPQETLDFNHARREEKPSETKTQQKQLSEGQQKRRQKKRDEIQKELKKRYELKKQRLASRQSKTQQPSPRYDDIYMEGVEWLDSLAGDEIKSGEFTAEICPSLWKSKARYDPDLS